MSNLLLLLRVARNGIRLVEVAMQMEMPPSDAFAVRDGRGVQRTIEKSYRLTGPQLLNELGEPLPATVEYRFQDNGEYAFPIDDTTFEDQDRNRYTVA